MPPLKLAVIGAGPSGMYVANRILSLLPQSQQIRIHMYDRLWAPYGLVRYGVAPDHPEVKNCIHRFREVGGDPRFRFFGNVDVRPSLASASPPSKIPHVLPLSMTSLLSHYTHLLIASGSPVPREHPHFPPAHPHVVPALDLVHWYTAHPSSPPPPPLGDVRRVAILGNGNVSLDIARILLMNPERLAPYDVPEHVLAVLRKSKVEQVDIIARRGPVQAAFTVKELRELMELPGVQMTNIHPSAFEIPDTTKLVRPQKRKLSLLKEAKGFVPGKTKKWWALHFYKDPIDWSLQEGTSDAKIRLRAVETKVDPETDEAKSTGKIHDYPVDMIVTSLGFRHSPSPLHYALSTPLRNVNGRVLSSGAEPRVVRGVYTSGWARYGAAGVINHAYWDANAVAETILADWLPASSGEQIVAALPEDADPEQSPAVHAEAGEVEGTVEIMSDDVDLDSVPEEVQHGLREGEVTTFEDFQDIDAEEVRRGQEKGKERERMVWQEARAFLALRKG